MLKQIFLIDDSEATNALNTALIQGMKIAENVLSFESPKMALDQLKKFIQLNNPLPEIIFLDIEMPEINGFDFLDSLVADLSTKNVETDLMVVFASNHLNIDNFTKTKDYKNEVRIEHLRKPIDKTDIQDLLEEYFESE